MVCLPQQRMVVCKIFEKSSGLVGIKGVLFQRKNDRPAGKSHSVSRHGQGSNIARLKKCVLIVSSCLPDGILGNFFIIFISQCLWVSTCLTTPIIDFMLLSSEPMPICSGTSVPWKGIDWSRLESLVVHKRLDKVWSLTYRVYVYIYMVYMYMYMYMYVCIYIYTYIYISIPWSNCLIISSLAGFVDSCWFGIQSKLSSQVWIFGWNQQSTPQNHWIQRRLDPFGSVCLGHVESQHVFFQWY